MNTPVPFRGLLDKLLGLIETKRYSDRIVLRVLFFVMIFSGLASLIALNDKLSVPTPISGGVLREGLIGTPRFVNPTLAITRVDQDVVALIYSGVMRIGQDGLLTPDLAESVTVSEDGLTYNIVIRKDVTFHDGLPLTARDVVFTYELIQNPDLKSPLKGNWADVTVEQVNEYEINIVLKEAYAPFNENFLVGILPAHIWSSVPLEQLPFSQLNTEPIGSGSFALKEAKRDESGLITAYILEANRKSRFAPHIDTMELLFFTEEDQLLTALKNKLIDASAYVSNEHIEEVIGDGFYRVVSKPLPRVFGVFFNQNKSVALRDGAVREALFAATDKTAIINKSLYGYGVPINSPISDLRSTLESEEGSLVATTTKDAVTILDQNGWAKNNLGLLEKQIDGSAETLSFTLRTSNATLLSEVSEQLVEDWKKVGADVAIEQFEQTDLLQSVIRPRDFEALLFGIDMSRSLDLYPFWHSSQKDDPGLNIAQYTNLSVDAWLEEARTEKDETERKRLLKEADTLIAEERPALFLFRPKLNYVVKSDIVISELPAIAHSSDRFSTIDTWYTSSDTLWNVFKNKN
ncbi:MAG: peptide ABC transporter substrate-binding protein [Patescibacteria group bacterium]